MAELKKGLSGPNVRKMQADLVLLGYALNVDGDFGSKTEQIVIQFQRQNALNDDGVFNEDTSIAMRQLTEQIVHGINIQAKTGDITWNNLALDDIKFVICKASQGIAHKDTKFDQYVIEINRMNIVFGAYHVLTLEGASAVDQVNNFLDCGIDYSSPGILPPIINVEWQSPEHLNAVLAANKDSYIQLMREWLEMVAQKTGRVPMIFTHEAFWRSYLNSPSGFEMYPLWIEGFDKKTPKLPKGWDIFTIWQFSADSGIANIKGKVERNRFNGTFEELEVISRPPLIP